MTQRSHYNSESYFEPMSGAFPLRKQGEVHPVICDQNKGTVAISFHPSGIKSLAEGTV
jgi:hypothetical protein